ncbi:MAG TPA: four helix bundle protein [Gemmatimonadales bacterium]|nr:four helix bundle protein [Gemmatimonadales bacterium]
MRDHKSLVAWQKARLVVDGVLVIGIRHWSPPAAAVIGQLQRSSLSVQLNIAEGHARRALPQFRYHLNIAYGSAVETIELLEILRDHSLIPATDAEATMAAAIETRALLLGLLRRYS